jgi:hypothetical protein
MPFHSHENEEEKDWGGGGGREKILKGDTYLSAEPPTGSPDLRAFSSQALI